MRLNCVVFLPLLKLQVFDCNFSFKNICIVLGNLSKTTTLPGKILTKKMNE